MSVRLQVSVEQRRGAGPLEHIRGSHPAPAQFSKVGRVRAYVVANLDDPDLSASGCARATGMSLRALHLALSTTDVSFGAMVVRLRLERCRKMLDDPDSFDNVADLAFACGFNSLSSFYRVFRREFGAAPLALLAQAA